MSPHFGVGHTVLKRQGSCFLGRDGVDIPPLIRIPDCPPRRADLFRSGCSWDASSALEVRSSDSGDCIRPKPRPHLLFNVLLGALPWLPAFTPRLSLLSLKIDAAALSLEISDKSLGNDKSQFFPCYHFFPWHHTGPPSRYYRHHRG